MYYVYVIRSKTTGRLYTGQTEDLERRLGEHNDITSPIGKFTKRNKGPWVLLHKETVLDRSEAVRREKYLKSGWGRRWLKKRFGNVLSGVAQSVEQAAVPS